MEVISNFKRGDIVTHVLGGRGEIRTLENDWSVEDPPRIVAVVRVLDTIFHSIRKIPVSELTKCRRSA